MEQEKEFSFLDGLKEIWRQKIGFLISFLIAALVVFFVLFFYSGANTKAYSNFNLSFYNSGQNRYSDNSLFSQSHLISRDKLIEVKNSHDKYADVDIDKMLFDKNITVYRNVVTTAETNIVIEENYNITVGANYFKSNGIAAEFILDLIELNLKTIETKSTSNLANYITLDLTDELEYIDLISVYKKQYEELIERYENLIEESKLPFNEVKIKNALATLNTRFENGNVFDNLTSTVITNTYLRFPDAVNESWAARIVTLKRERDFLKSLIDDIKANPGASSSLLDEKYIKFHELEQEIALLESLMNGNEATESFKSELSKVESELNKFSEEYSRNYIETLNNSIYFLFTGEEGNVEYDKPVSTLVAVLLSVLIGVFAGLGFVYIKYLVEKEKSKKAPSLEIEDASVNDKE